MATELDRISHNVGPVDGFLDTLYRQRLELNYYRFLYSVAVYIKAKLSVELGVCTGTGTAHIAAGTDGPVYGIDPHPWDMTAILTRYPNIVLFRERSESSSVLDILEGRKGRGEGMTDLLFIDTVHTYEQAKREYELYRPYMSHGGIICYDDIFLNDSMKRFWVWLPENKKMALSHLHPESGFGVSVCT